MYKCQRCCRSVAACESTLSWDVLGIIGARFLQGSRVGQGDHVTRGQGLHGRAGRGNSSAECLELGGGSLYGLLILCEGEYVAHSCVYVRLFL
jgi:hypothetical protein